MKKIISAKGMAFKSEIERYQAIQDKDKDEVNIRNAKVMLYTLFNLANYEVDNMLQHWDGYDGFISVVKMQQALTSGR
jgi:hypothetical protein